MYVKKEHEGEDFYIRAICTRRFLYIRDLYHRRPTVKISLVPAGDDRNTCATQCSIFEIPIIEALSVIYRYDVLMTSMSSY